MVQAQGTCRPMVQVYVYTCTTIATVQVYGRCMVYPTVLPPLMPPPHTIPASPLPPSQEAPLWSEEHIHTTLHCHPLFTYTCTPALAHVGLPP